MGQHEIQIIHKSRQVKGACKAAPCGNVACNKDILQEASKNMQEPAVKSQENISVTLPIIPSEPPKGAKIYDVYLERKTKMEVVLLADFGTAVLITHYKELASGIPCTALAISKSSFQKLYVKRA